jgi:hypothetical protein
LIRLLLPMPQRISVGSAHNYNEALHYSAFECIAGVIGVCYQASYQEPFSQARPGAPAGCGEPRTDIWGRTLSALNIVELQQSLVITNTMHVDEQNRKRRKAPKTRNGCRPCKQAHVRCSEDKPVCQRCLRLEKECSYEILKPRVFNASQYHDACHDTHPQTPSQTTQPTNLHRHHPFFPTSSSLIPSPARSLLHLHSNLPAPTRRALHHYLSHTAPWIATHAPRTLRTTWTVTIPRLALSLPATFHALLAVALLDEPIANPTTEAVSQRAREVLGEYNKAIGRLIGGRAGVGGGGNKEGGGAGMGMGGGRGRGPGPDPLDVTLASILAWLLEVLGLNAGMAGMHIQAAKRMVGEGGWGERRRDERLMGLVGTRSKSKALEFGNREGDGARGGESESVWALDVPALLAFATGYMTITSGSGHRATSDEVRAQVAANPVLEALLLRRGRCPVSHMGEVRDAWVEYFVKLMPSPCERRDKGLGEGEGDGGAEERMTVEEAQEFIAYWKIAVVRYRYLRKEPAEVVLLGYTMSALARCLLPTEPAIDGQEAARASQEARHSSIDFILTRAEDMLGVEMSHEHKALQEDLLCLLAGTIMRSGFNERQQERARKVWDACGRKTDWFALADEEDCSQGTTTASSSLDTPPFGRVDDLFTVSHDFIMQKVGMGTQLLFEDWPST